MPADREPLSERIRGLEEDLLADPIRISAYHDLPFAIFHYPPGAESTLRKEVALLATRLDNAGRRVRFLSLGRALWRAIRETEGVEAIAEEERDRGFERAQRAVGVLLSDHDFLPLASQVGEAVRKMEPAREILFIVRTAALAPAIYRCAVLLDEMHGRTMVPIVLFYPGTLEGTTELRFMDLPAHSGAYNYRVRIY
jgi:hypothetical protein